MALAQTCDLIFNEPIKESELNKNLAELLKLKTLMTQLPPGSPQLSLLRKNFDSRISDLKKSIEPKMFSELIEKLRKTPLSTNDASSLEPKIAESRSSERAELIGPKELKLGPLEPQTQPLELKIAQQINRPTATLKFEHHPELSLVEVTEKKFLLKFTKYYVHIFHLDRTVEVEKNINYETIGFHPEGNTIFYVDGRGQIYSWETAKIGELLKLKEAKKLAQININPNFEGGYHRLLISSNEQYAVLTDLWRIHHIFEIPTAQSATIVSQDGGNPNFRISPDSSKIIAFKDQMLTQMDLGNKPMNAFHGIEFFGDSQLKQMVWNAQSSDFAVILSTYQKGIILYSGKTKQVFGEIPNEQTQGFMFHNTQAQWSPNGKYLAVALKSLRNTTVLYIFNPLTQEVVHKEIPEIVIEKLQWAQAGQVIISGHNTLQPHKAYAIKVEVQY